jgi:hypothetical protein
MIAEPTGTDGHRYIGRPCHSSLLKSSSQAANDILVYKHPTVEPSYEQRCPGSDPHWKIPVVEWPTVLHRIDQGDPLRKVAGDYGVSYETVRRVLHAARRR